MICLQWSRLQCSIFETVPRVRTRSMAFDRRRRHVMTVYGRYTPQTAAVRTLL